MCVKNITALAATTWLFFAGGVFAEAIDVGVTTSGVPFTFVDTQTGKPTGAMVDIANAIGAEIGAEMNFEITAFSALIPSLTTGKIDLISAGMLITDKRAVVVDFSDSPYSYGDAMFVAAGNPENYSRDDLAGEVIGAQVGTVYADALTEIGGFGEIKLYDSIVDIMRDVQLGRIKAGFGDGPIVGYQVSQNPELGVRLVEGYEPMKPGNVALAVNKGNTELLTRVNEALAKLQSSGELQAIFDKYGL